MTAIRATIITDFAAQRISANHIISINFVVRKQPLADASPVRTALKLVWAAATGGSADGGRRHAVGNLPSASLSVVELSYGKHGHHSYALLAATDLARGQIELTGGGREWRASRRLTCVALYGAEKEEEEMILIAGY